ncbi:baseplate J/gp47 family protein [Janthinobacterium sp. SUN137]|uniref:baseplate J/gp47 family protein n=1 Tax=Janthinobacterium sp. SUN137 TaxID=3014789 RepID=UPI00271227A0|nr:baseplate J/gp47 family protein [Janthinobacterium sp. SUN137]MDO8039514.1 baseplate J/gp47 family protein [Janthinobacterium sp. SUN137]
MSISTKDFVTLVRDAVTAIQGSASGLVNLTVGSILRAVVEANATVILWLQGLILQLLAATRAATSNDADLDSWMADFGVVRLGAVPASGLVSFSRFTPTAQAVVPVGATVLTLDGTQAYVALLDATNSAYSALLGGYVLAPGVVSINITVTASTPGAAANAVAGQIALINQPIPGVDAVSNATGFTNGVDAEKNAALRARFITYIASLSKATKLAIGNAITSLAQGVTFSLTENFTYGGVAQNGYFFAVIDDGTGYPPSQLLLSAANAIDAVRPFTSTFGVFAPIVVTANIAMTITTAAGYDHMATAANVAAALGAYVNSLTLGQKLAFSRMTQIAYDASPGVTNVTAIMLNGGTADLAASALQVIKTGSVSVA